MEGPLTTLETELTMRRSDFAYLHAAFQHVGWKILDDVEGVTTDDGYDHELRARVRIQIPLEALAGAPDHREVVGEATDGLFGDLRVVA